MDAPLPQQRLYWTCDGLYHASPAPTPLVIAARGDEPNPPAQPKDSRGILECCSLNWVVEGQKQAAKACDGCVDVCCPG